MILFLLINLFRDISITVHELEGKVSSLQSELDALKSTLQLEKSAREELQALVKVKMPGPKHTSIDLRICE